MASEESLQAELDRYRKGFADACLLIDQLEVERDHARNTLVELTRILKGDPRLGFAALALPGLAVALDVRGGAPWPPAIGVQPVKVDATRQAHAEAMKRNAKALEVLG